MSNNKRIPASQSHDEMVAEWKNDPAFKAEYDNLEDEYKLLREEMLAARKRAGLKQSEVAERMGTQPSAIARLEANKGQEKHSPSINTLQRYANAVGCKLKVEIEPIEKEKQTKHSN